MLQTTINKGFLKKYQKEFILLGNLIIFFLILGGVYLLFKEKGSIHAELVVSNPVVQELSKLAELPDEEPQVVTIKDKSRLAQQDFFERAENGDKIIIYKEAHKAYLFRLEQKRIINITTFNTTEISSAKTENENQFQESGQLEGEY